MRTWTWRARRVRWLVVGLLAIIAGVLNTEPGLAVNILNDNRGQVELLPSLSGELTTLLLGVGNVFPAAITPRVLSRPEIHNVFWDNNWDAHNPGAPSRADIDGFTAKLVGSGYFDSAGQYGVSTPIFTGSDSSTLVCGILTPGSFVLPWAPFPAPSLFSWVTCMVGFNPVLPGGPPLSGVPQGNPNSLYVIYLPARASTGNCLPYHFYTSVPVLSFDIIVPVVNPQSVAYAVVPLCAGSTQVDVKANATHEILEAATDPLIGLGWLNNSRVQSSEILDILNTASGYVGTTGLIAGNDAEAADLCENADPTAYLGNGTYVAKYWSNADGKCVPANRPPRLVLPGSQVGDHGDQLTFKISVADTGETVFLAASGLPAGLSFRDNGDGTGTVAGTVSAPAGIYPVTFSATDSFIPAITGTGAVNVTVTSGLKTSIGLTPPTPTGQNGWYKSPVQIIVSTSDPDDTTGIETRCVLDPTTPPTSFNAIPTGCAYTGAGAPVGTDGLHTLYAGGADDGGADIEAPIQSQNFKIDTTPPTVTYSGNADSYTVDQQVQITCTATDATSGVASSTCQNISGPAYSFGLGTHSYSATATDYAGNTRSPVSTSFTVIVTPSSLQTLINRFCTDPSVAASLDQDVANIAHAPNANAKAGMLQGFTHLVQAQTGKSLTSDQAKVLVTLADALP